MRIEQPGPTTFLELADTPDLYTSQSGKKVSVKTDETGLEFSADVGGTWNEESPSAGLVNGINKDFTFTHAPAFISLEGQALSELNGDYTKVGNTITLAFAPTLNPPINKYLS